MAVLAATVLRSLHPLIRVFIFLVFAVLVAHADLVAIFVAAVVLSLVYALVDRSCLTSAWKMVFRIRWIFLSLFLIYAWFTPSDVSASSASAWLPSAAGMVNGLIHVMSLLMIVLAVNLLLSFTAKTDLMLALRWMVTPLAVLGVSRDRVALRMMLVMDTVAGVQVLVGDALKEIHETRFTLVKIGAVTGEVFQRVLNKADQQEEQTIVLQPLCAPPFWQWLIPAFLGIFLLLPF